MLMIYLAGKFIQRHKKGFVLLFPASNVVRKNEWTEHHAFR